jgi:hypothetical protein
MTAANADVSFEPLLNTVTLQFNAEQWAAAKTALVTVGINASLNNKGLESIQGEVLNKLNQISNKAEWHIISFNRNLDQSGLERIQMSAVIRLSSADLSHLRDIAKTISKPGETYTIDAVEFTPSEQELRDVNTVLRNTIYQQIQNEITNLNKMYPDQKYYVHSVNFLGGITPEPMPPTAMVYKSDGGAARNIAIAVGDKARLSATVIVASAPNAEVIKMVHN